MTNGVFYVDRGVECVLVSQSGTTVTNKLEAGRTYQTGNVLLEMAPTNTSTFFFSGGPLFQAGADSKFTVLSFDQDVENLNANPRLAKFGMHLINLSLEQGEFCIVYPNKDENSRVNISTQYANYELTGGLYYFRVGKTALVYVLEGGMIVHGETGRSDSVDGGSFVVAVPLEDMDTGLTDKFITSFKKVQGDEMERFVSPVLAAEKNYANVDFFVIGGKVIGFLLK